MRRVTKDYVSHRLRRASRIILGKLHIDEKTVDFFLLRDAEMRALKRRFGKRPAHRISHRALTVDVLAFPRDARFPSPDRRLISLGEIYLNWDLGNRDPERLLVLFLHGVLHLCGYRHEKKSDSMVMEKLEKQLWRHISSLV